MIVKPFELDKSKVKRIFTFGCSFTNFIWPTWANIIAKEIDQAEFYNFGGTGLGNLAITARVSETNAKMNFSDTDLIMILWSTFLREDRWLRGKWFGAGNIFSTGMYDRNFVENYTDICGYVIRDCALISITKVFLENLPCQSIMMPSVPIDYIEASKDESVNTLYTDVIQLYEPIFTSMPKSLYDYLKVDNVWPTSHTYYWPEMKMQHNDNHPSPLNAFDYLENNIVHLSEKTKKYAENCTNELRTLKTKKDIVERFEYDTKQNLLF